MAVEEPLEIRVGFPGAGTDGESLVITMRTPGSDEELARGFLFTEGLIRQPADVLEFVVADPSEGAGQRPLSVSLRNGLQDGLSRNERNFYTNSSCGICGKASLEALRVRATLEVRGD